MRVSSHLIFNCVIDAQMVWTIKILNQKYGDMSLDMVQCTSVVGFAYGQYTFCAYREEVIRIRFANIDQHNFLFNYNICQPSKMF